MEKRSLPWDSILTPSDSAIFASTPADILSVWPSYWVVDYAGDCGLLLLCDGIDVERKKLPKLEFLECSFRTTDSGCQVLLFLIRDDSKKQVFYEFCKSILSAIEKETSLEAAIDKAVKSIWEWLRLLKGKTSNLSQIEQRGLIAELLFLSERLAKSIGYPDAIKAWTGPLGTPKDFNISDYAVEVKSHCTSAQPNINISSENQLDPIDYEYVWLNVTTFAEATESDPNGMSLSDVYRMVVEEIEEISQSALDDFNNLMQATGFGLEVDYSSNKWIKRSDSIYLVSKEFPMIKTEDIPRGVTRVRYSIELAELERHRIEYTEVENVIKQGQK